MFSVLMSVYFKDSPIHLNDALVSIWDLQTVKPSQIVLVEDGPLSSELNCVIQKWRVRLDHTFDVVKLPTNQGLGPALNMGLNYCKFDLVARMDADDISVPERFEVQCDYMSRNPEIAVSSGNVEEWDFNMKYLRGVRSLPSSYNEIKRFALYRSPLNHPAVIFRKGIITSYGSYPNIRNGQDYALWSLLLKNNVLITNIDHVLVKMRAGNELLSRRGLNFFRGEVQLLKFQRSIGFISLFRYFVNLNIRFFYRVVPMGIKKYLYFLLR